MSSWNISTLPSPFQVPPTSLKSESFQRSYIFLNMYLTSSFREGTCLHAAKCVEHLFDLLSVNLLFCPTNLSLTLQWKLCTFLTRLDIWLVTHSSLTWGLSSDSEAFSFHITIIGWYKTERNIPLMSAMFGL